MSLDRIIEHQSRNLVFNRTLGAALRYTSRHTNVTVFTFGYMIDGVIVVFSKVIKDGRYTAFIKRVYSPNQDTLVISPSNATEFADEFYLSNKLSSRKYFTGKLRHCS